MPRILSLRPPSAFRATVGAKRKRSYRFSTSQRQWCAGTGLFSRWDCVTNQARSESEDNNRDRREKKKQKQPPCGKNVNGQENSGRGSGLGGAQGGDASCDALRNGSRKLKKLANALTFGSLLLHFLDCSWRFSLATRYSRKTRVYSGS